MLASSRSISLTVLTLLVGATLAMFVRLQWSSSRSLRLAEDPVICPISLPENNTVSECPVCPACSVAPPCPQCPQPQPCPPLPPLSPCVNPCTCGEAITRFNLAVLREPSIHPYGCSRRPRKPYNMTEWEILSRPEKRVISTSVFGEVRYVKSLYRNIELWPTIYPGWTFRIYLDDSVPADDIRRFKEAGCEVIQRDRGEKLQGTFWRFEVADDPTVDRYIVRDVDSRFTRREAMAVEEWILSGKPYHIMRDHPGHSGDWVMMAGMWGGIKDPNLKITEKMLKRKGEFYEDQKMLAEDVWPYIEDKHLAHDTFSCSACEENPKNCRKTFPSSIPWPTPRPAWEHVGMRVDEHDIVRTGDVSFLLQTPLPPACTTCIS